MAAISHGVLIAESRIRDRRIPLDIQWHLSPPLHGVGFFYARILSHSPADRSRLFICSLLPLHTSSRSLRFSSQRWHSPTMPLRKLSTQITKMAPRITLTQSPSAD